MNNDIFTKEYLRVIRECNGNKLNKHLIKEDFDDDDDYDDYEAFKVYNEQCDAFESAASSLFSEMLEKYKLNFIKEIVKEVEASSRQSHLSDLIRGDRKYIKNGVIYPVEFVDGYFNVVFFEHPEKWPEFKEKINDILDLCPEEYESSAISDTDDGALEFIKNMVDKKELCDYLKELNLTIEGLEE